MILSFVSAQAADGLLSGFSCVAVLAYALAASGASAAHERWQWALPVGFIAHLLALLVDMSGMGLAQPGARFGFAPALSTTALLILAVYLVESRLLPLANVRRGLALMAATAVVLAWVWPGETRPQAASPWAPLHWVLGFASYGLFGVAVLHAALLGRSERQMRLKSQSMVPVLGMPLLRLERLTFQFVGAGVIALSAALALGWWFTPTWHWDHKTLLSVLGWVVLTGLLTGRRVLGWRGKRATRWLYVGAALLLLAYVGTRFVLEVLLQRVAGAV